VCAADRHTEAGTHAIAPAHLGSSTRPHAVPNASTQTSGNAILTANPCSYTDASSAFAPWCDRVIKRLCSSDASPSCCRCAVAAADVSAETGANSASTRRWRARSAADACTNTGADATCTTHICASSGANPTGSTNARASASADPA